MKTGIIIPKVFNESNFSSLPVLKKVKRGVRSQLGNRGNTQSAVRVKSRICVYRKTGIPVGDLPFKDSGMVVHRYARPSRIITEVKMETQEAEECFSSEMKKFMNRFSGLGEISACLKPRREGFYGCKRSKVYLEVVKKNKGKIIAV